MDYGTKVGSLPVPTRTGHTFLGWFTAAADGEQILDDAAVTGATTLYAQWQVNKYTVAFDANGGDAELEAKAVEYGSEYGELPVPARKGCIFDGWFAAADGGAQIFEDSKMLMASDHVLYAHWTELVLHDEEAIETPAPATSASEYNGCLYDDAGNMRGTIQVKIGAPNKKTGLATASATVQIGTAKKKTLKGVDKGKTVIASDGPTDIEFVGGEECVVTLGSYGMAGYYGAYEIDGSRNVFTSKDKSEASAAAKAIEKWVGAYVVMWDGGTASVTIDKKGKAKASITLSGGAKGTATSQMLVGDEWLCVPVMVTKKMNVAFTLWLPADGGEVVVNGLGDDVVAGRGGALKAGAAFRIDEDEFAAVTGINALPYLPDGVPVAQKGSKLTLPKAGKLTVKKGVLDDSKAGENPSGLKLTLKKDGTFTGSFKVYYIEKGKLKSKTANVSGVVLNGVGYGTATVKGKSGVPVTIE